MDITFVYETKDKNIIRVNHPELGSFNLSRRSLSCEDESIFMTINGKSVNLKKLVDKIRVELPEVFL